MKRQRNTAQMKEQTRNTEVQINEEEIGKLPKKELRIMILKMIKNLENKMEKMQESINKDLEELKNKHTETNNTITETKNTLEKINSRISEAEESINELEDNMVEISFEEQNKVKKKWKEPRIVSETSSTTAAKSLQSCLTLSDSMDCSLPGSSIHGILQARVLEWDAIAFSGLT